MPQYLIELYGVFYHHNASRPPFYLWRSNIEGDGNPPFATPNALLARVYSQVSYAPQIAVTAANTRQSVNDVPQARRTNIFLLGCARRRGKIRNATGLAARVFYKNSTWFQAPRLGLGCSGE